MITTAFVKDTTKELLAFLKDDGFAYVSAANQFRRRHHSGYSYITLSAVTHDRRTYELAFYLAVQVTEVETKKRELIAASVKLGHFDRTIWCYTVNIGPGSPHWDYPVRGNWRFTDEKGLLDAKAQIGAFTRDLSLPYISRHVDPQEIRKTLFTQKGHAQNLYPFQEILTIDLLFSDREQLRADIEHLRTNYFLMAPLFRSSFEDFAALPHDTPSGGSRAEIGSDAVLYPLDGYQWRSIPA